MNTNLYHSSLMVRVAHRFNLLSGSRFLVCLCALLGGLVVHASADDLADALDNTNLVWTTNGNAGWFAQTNTTHDGVDAAQSGAITHSQQSLLESSVVGPGTLMFWWKVSSESSYDYLRFKVGGIQQAAVSGEIGWEQKAIYLAAGTQALQWAYTKDGSVNAGQDKAWVDQVSFTLGGTEPIIVTQPTNRTVAAGSNTNFNVMVTGTPSFSYQWFFGVTNLVGATNSTLTLTNIQPGQAGGYSVVISNSYGSATSEVATLTVNVFPPTITAHPQSQLLPPGGAATFTVAATGTQPLGYQWQFNSNNVAGATNATFTLTNVQPTNAGSYRVTVSNDYGSTNSSNAVLTLSVPKTLTVTNLANSGPGTLRQLIADAVTGDTIDFAVTGTIALTNGQLTIGKYLNIAGPGATNLTVSGNGSSRVFNVTNGSVLLSGLTIANGTTGGDGGGIFNSATLTVSNCAFTTNYGYWGGAIRNDGVVVVENSTFTGGSANSGAAIRNHATATVRNCTVSGNNAVVGGGLYNGSGTMTLQSCTVCSNSASSTFTGAGGVYNSATLTLTNCIVANNTAASNPDVGGSITSQGYCLFGTDPKLGPLQYNGGQTKTHALLFGSPAIDNGNSAGLGTDQRGAARIIDIPYLVNAGDGADIGAYEVESSAPQVGPSFLVTTTDDVDSGACTIGHCSLREAINAANSTSGAHTVSFASGVTGQTTLTNGELSISQDVTIIGPGITNLTVSGNNLSRVFNVMTGVVFISKLTIANGKTTSALGGGGILNQAGTITVSNVNLSANSSSNGAGVFNAGTLVVDRTTLSSNTATNGAGIYNTGTLTVRNSTVSSNQASRGGGIHSVSGLIVERSTFSDNSATIDGGALYNLSGTAAISNSTVFANNATNAGGGILNSGTVNLRNTIIAGNGAASGPDCNGTIASQDFNLIQNTSGCVLTGVTAHNITGQSPLLAPLADNGGHTLTHALLSGSPVIDAGNCDGDTADQRDKLRPVDLPSTANAANGSDIGAYEYGHLSGPAFLVSTNDDVDLGAATVVHCSLREAINAANAFGAASTISFSAGVTGTINLTGPLASLTGNVTITGPGSGSLTVRRNTGGNYRILTIPAGANATISGLTISNGRPADFGDGGAIFSSGTLALNSCVISGSDAYDGGGIYNSGSLTASNCIISGNGITYDGYGGGINNDGGTVSLMGCVIIGNSSGNDISDGGGIYNPQGTCIVNNSVISGNTAYAGVGGGIYNGGTLTVTNSTFSGNTAIAGGGLLNEGGNVTVHSCTVSGNNAYDDDGGGLWNNGVMGLLNSTVYGNSSDFSGGGIYAAGTVTITSSTISGNLGYDGGGIDGAATLRNTILAGNGTHTVAGQGPDCWGTITSADYNLIQKTNNCSITGATAHNLIGLDPKLGPLANNTGPTFTCALLTGSPAVDRGANNGLATDQRGQPRGIDNPDFPNASGGDASDIGAFEADVTVSDGLPDTWELQYFGHIGFGPDDDVDGDGVSNLAEFLAGTNPAGAASAPRLVSPSRTGNGQFQFQMIGPVGSNYVIQASTNLSTWIPISTNVIPGGGGGILITDPFSTNYSRRFYRAVSQ